MCKIKKHIFQGNQSHLEICTGHYDNKEGGYEFGGNKRSARKSIPEKASSKQKERVKEAH